MLFLFFTPYAYYNEEARIGSIGHDILFENGLRLPFWGYLDSPHSGGSIFSGLLAIPFYLIFGDRYLALKITALVLSLLTLILWYKLLALETGGSRKTFIFTLLFFTFATPHYVQKSVILSGNTVELMFFNILIIYYFWKIKKHFENNIDYLLLGVLCGFSFWVQFMSFYLLVAIVLTILCGGRLKLGITRIFFIMLGFLLGTLPLWIYNFQYRWATFTADHRVMGSKFFLFNTKKLNNFMFVDLPASFHFLDINSIKGETLSFIVYSIFIFGVGIYLADNFLGAIRNTFKKSQVKRDINLPIFLILFMFIFIIFTSFMSFPISGEKAHGWNSMSVHAEYYIILLQPVIFALLIMLNKYRARFILILQIIVSLIFILSYCRLFHDKQYNDSLLKPKHSTEANAYECGFNFDSNPALFLEFKNKISNGSLQESYLKGGKHQFENTYSAPQ